ncbi:hypothetical protein OQA88_6868 [Cercophora sp. LCS_1]
MPSSGEPRHSAAGSQAAVFAIGSAQRHQQSQSPQSAAWVNSAANIAFRSSMAPVQAVESRNLGRHGSMHAAKDAMGRPRARSSPGPKEMYPDQANAAFNALSAATLAHRPSLLAGAVPVTTMSRAMYTSHPPVKPELDEQRRNDMLHASAVAMAKQMYSRNQGPINTARANTVARSSSFSRHGSASVNGEGEEQPLMFNNLQEAAYRLAQERLAKLHDEHQKNRNLQDYYGASNQQPRNKLDSIRNKLTRRRSASDGALVEDKRRSLQIRKQMSLFDTKLAEVDEQKRAKDREALLATAHRNVQARLRDLDKKVQEETGWVAPTKKEDWEWRARAAAHAKFDASRLETQRKVDIGGGKMMDRDAVEAIAAKRVQPLLDEINEKAEKERERLALQRAEEEKAQEEVERDKMREKEVQEIHKKLKGQQKDQDRARKIEIKNEEKARKEDEKAAKAEQKRLAKEGKRKGKAILVLTPTNETPAQQPGQNDATIIEPESASNKRHSRALSINFPKRHSRQKSKDLPRPTDPESENISPTSKVKSWLKTHLTRPRSQSTPAIDSKDENEKKFVGGAALANMSYPSEHRRSTSIREVAMAGRRDDTRQDSAKPGESSAMGAVRVSTDRVQTPSPEANEDDSTSLDTRSISSLSSADRFEEARTSLSEGPITPPPKFPRAKPASPARGSRFSELLG